MQIHPKGKQNEVLALPPKGHIIVLGTAGSGKTTIALLRAKYLSTLHKNDKVLLVAFNNALMEYMRSILHTIPENLIIKNYHKVAYQYLHARGKWPRGTKIADSKETYTLVEEVLTELRKKYAKESTFKRPTQFFVDEISFIEKFGFNDFEEYEGSERIGRSGAYLARKNRKWTYMAYEKYIASRTASGMRYDWDDIAFHVCKDLQEDSSERLYRHIIVDEGQDLSPTMIRSLVALAAPDGSFTFFGDVAQQIYGSRLSWRDSGIKTNKVWSFDANYRNSGAVTDFAKDITESAYWQKSEDMIDPLPSLAEGPKPLLIKFADRTSEFQWIVKQAIELGQLSSVAVICRTISARNKFKRLLENTNASFVIIDKYLTNVTYDNGIFLTTFHASKGLEFDHVFLPNLEDDVLPDPNVVKDAISKEEAFSDELKLLYVGATRSKYGLYMTYHDTLSPLFPQTASSYERINGDELE